jgi:hypothetical protein
LLYAIILDLAPTYLGGLNYEGQITPAAIELLQHITLKNFISHAIPFNVLEHPDDDDQGHVSLEQNLAWQANLAADIGMPMANVSLRQPGSGYAPLVRDSLLR